jgi:hypothetical protein
VSSIGEYEHQSERAGGYQHRVTGPLGGGHGAVGRDPGDVGLANFRQCGRACLVGGGQQLEYVGPLILGNRPDRHLQVRHQAV